MITLRPLTLLDAPALAKYANNPNVAKYLREIFPCPYTVKDAERWITIESQVTNSFNLAIDCNDECIGNIGMRIGEDEHRYTAEFGYWLGEPHWGQGYASIAIREFIHTVFTEFDLRRLYTAIPTENLGSIGAAENAGLIREATFRKNTYLRGQLYDEAIFAAYP